MGRTVRSRLDKRAAYVRKWGADLLKIGDIPTSEAHRRAAARRECFGVCGRRLAPTPACEFGVRVRAVCMHVCTQQAGFLIVSCNRLLHVVSTFYTTKHLALIPDVRCRITTKQCEQEEILTCMRGSAVMYVTQRQHTRDPRALFPALRSKTNSPYRYLRRGWERPLNLPVRHAQSRLGHASDTADGHHHRNGPGRPEQPCGNRPVPGRSSNLPTSSCCWWCELVARQSRRLLPPSGHCLR